MPYRWTFYPDSPPDAVLSLMNGLKASPILARVLWNRGIQTVSDGQRFLASSLSDLHDPFLMSGMAEAVTRIERALEKDEVIGVYGDYDVDGVTGAALLYRFFRSLGARVFYRIPDRMREGYGLSVGTIDDFAKEGLGLLITIDCGINSLAEVLHARSLGIDVIVVDHHTTGESLPDCSSVVNPHRRDCAYPFKHLTGVALAMKLALAVARARRVPEERVLEDLDLVAVGSIADVAPLVGENRVLVKRGLSVLSNSKKIGFRELVRSAGFERRDLGVWQVAFGLAPRINAAGRIGDARAAVELLTTDSPDVARMRAAELERENDRRREMDFAILAQALEMIGGEASLGSSRVIVLSSAAWHPGVIGIAASRVKERFGLPAILIAVDGEMGRGSARGVPGFSLYDALSHCTDLLVTFGGHEQAAGFTIRKAMIEEFRARIGAYAREHLAGKDLTPSLKIDGELPLDYIGLELFEEIRLLAPFGPENSEPVFIAKGLVPAGRVQVVGRGHVKFAVSDGDRRVDVIAFDKANLVETGIFSGGPFDLAFTLGENQYLGDRVVQLRLKDIQPAGVGDPAGIAPALESF
jgi:single-stranded-DNA-specific exonuclease